MRASRIDFDTLVTIEDHLKALVAAEDAIGALEYQLATSTHDENGWTNRATFALASWKTARRRVTARLAVLRQQEKEHNVAIHDRHNEYLIAELKKYIPKAAFLACDYRAKVKTEVSTDEH